MKLGVRGKLFVVSLSLVGAAGLVGGLYLEGALKRWINARIEHELSTTARMARDLLELGSFQESIDTMDPVADRLGASAGARITIIDAQGVVLGDSELDGPALEAVENHGQRPEVRGGMTRGIGISRRSSTTLEREMLYAAVPFRSPAGRGTVRAAMPLAEVRDAVERLRVILIVGGLLGLGLAVFMSGLASELATRAIRGLVENARSVTKADRRGRVAVLSGDELGRLAGSFNRVLDELDHAMASLVDEREHLETILDSMSEGVIALDPDKRVARMNRAARTLLGLNSDRVGEPFIEVIRTPELAELAVGEARDVDAMVEVELHGSRQVQAHAAPLSSGGRLLVLRDITRTRKLEEIRRDFVANVSHELRTPVSVIKANSETLLDGALEDPERGRQFLEAVHRNADRLSRVVSDLLDLSRIEAGRYGMEVSAVDLDTAVRRVMGSLERPARAKEQTLASEVPPGTCVEADLLALEQVIHNLVDNAIKYTPRGGQITVRAALAGDTVRIEVQDDGPGIELRHRDRVFERFYRVDPGRSRELGGTGLGLSIVKHLVEAMRGSVGYEPRSPQGSTFWLTLPRTVS